MIPDHEAGVFNPPIASADKFTSFDKLVFFILGGFRRWDAVYILHIAEHGYTFENCVAFFPLYPMIVSLVKVLPITVVSQASQLLLFAVGVNLLLFAATAVILFHLGKTVVKDLELALCAAHLFCINPASIFMIAPYTETLFAFLSFLGMLYISKKLVWTGAFVLSASALTRSNGLVSVGFILHYLTQTYIFQGAAIWKAKTGRGNFKELLWPMLQFIFRAVCVFAIVIAPFAFYQYYIYHLFCNPKKQLIDSVSSEIVVYGRLQRYTMVGDPPSAWCYYWLPLSYSYVQNQHWGVGLLTYFQVKQIPNFILAAPVIILSFGSCWDYYQKQKSVCHTLGLIKIMTKKTEHKADGESQIRGWAQPDVMVYILHLLFLTVFGCLFMHIQVSWIFDKKFCWIGNTIPTT